jgi:dipeptidase E
VCSSDLETRIKEFLTFNDQPVVGLREGSMLYVLDDSIVLKGVTDARVFEKGKEPVEYKPGDSLGFLLSANHKT